MSGSGRLGLAGALFVALSCAPPGVALRAAAPPPMPPTWDDPAARDTAELIAIRAGRLVDVERGTVLEDRIILVRGRRIEAVRPATEGIPEDARLLDLSPHTVLPGLMDAHSHLVGDITSASLVAPLERTEAEETLAGVANARRTLMAGFTTVRDVGTYRALVDVALREAIERGTVAGPRMAVAGAYVTVSSGGGELAGLAPDVDLPRELRFGVANSADEVRRVVREILNGGADFVKVIATGAVLTTGSKPGVPEYTEAEIRAAVEEAALYGAHVAAHAHGPEGIHRAVRAGVRSIEHGSLIDDEGIALMRERGTWLVADIYNGDYIDSVGRAEGWSEEVLRKNAETVDAQRQGFRKAVEAGVNIAYGTDAGVYPHGWNARQLPYMVEWGMTPMEALRSATLGVARLLGWEDRVGSVATGRYADLIAVRGDPLEDLAVLADVDFVMKGGEVVKLEGRPCGCAR